MKKKIRQIKRDKNKAEKKDNLVILFVLLSFLFCSFFFFLKVEETGEMIEMKKEQDTVKNNKQTKIKGTVLCKKIIEKQRKGKKRTKRSEKKRHSNFD